MPFIYLPIDDYKAFSKSIRERFGADIQCQDDLGCYFSKNCDFVEKKDFNIYVHLTTP